LWAHLAQPVRRPPAVEGFQAAPAAGAGLDRAAAEAVAAAAAQVAPAEVVEQPEDPEHLGQMVPQASPAPAAVAERVVAAEPAVRALEVRAVPGLLWLGLETTSPSIT
jgi:hypothetical protein